MTARTEVTLPDSTFTDMNMRYAADRGSRHGIRPQTRRLVPEAMTPTERFEALWYSNDRRGLADVEDVEDVVTVATSTFEPDYDEDPADARRTRSEVAHFPAEPTAYPNVTIGPRYRFGFAVASRYLEYQEDGIGFYDAVVLLGVEFDIATEQEVTDVLAYMGIEEVMRESPRSGPTGIAIVHGTIKTYNRLGCRCSRCRRAVEDHREKIGLSRKIPRPSRASDRVNPALSIPHGTNNGYANRGCRCDECREAARLYRLDRKERTEARKRDAARSAAIADRGANRDY